jgi:hypothetical protein
MCGTADQVHCHAELPLMAGYGLLHRPSAEIPASGSFSKTRIVTDDPERTVGFILTGHW